MEQRASTWSRVHRAREEHRFLENMEIFDTASFPLSREIVVANLLSS